MRKRINVLWLDDDQQSNCKEIQSTFKEIIADKGYVANVITAETIEKAERMLANKKERIDFFVSDLNLNNGASGKDGIDFLKTIRSQKMDKQFFVLYSHVARSSLRDSIYKKISANRSVLDFLRNFAFLSVGDAPTISLIKADLSEILDIALVRWDELSALRGEYAAINTLADSILDHLFGLLHRNVTRKRYSEKIALLKKSIDQNNLAVSLPAPVLSVVFDKWKTCRETRNSLEHNAEKWDPNKSDFYILDTELNANIYESDVAVNRKKIIEETEHIKRLFQDLINQNSSLSALSSFPEFIDFMNDI